ncbi:hypothetical protein MY3957_005761, partial [Beauveria namnaoensis]
MSLTCAGIGSPIVAYLGPIASYSQQAALQAFGEDVWQLKPVDTIQDIFVEVQSQCATWGVVPLENSANGAVDLTLNGLADYNRSYVNIQVGGDTYVPVNHYLLGHHSPTVPSATSQSSKAQELPIDSFQHIQKVYSHPQALGQCSKFLDKYLKNAQRLEITASAISNKFNNRYACLEAASSAYTTTHSTVTTTTTTTTTENMLVCSTVIPPEDPLEHWLYTSEIDERALDVLNRPDIAGAQVLYNWKSLESNKGEYDFREVRNDMQRVQAKGKKFWIQLQDRSFSPQLDPVPRYMKTKHYNNGSAPQCDGESCDKHFKIDGWVAQQWNPRVRERFQALLKAMAEELNGKIYGLNLAETSIEVDTQANDYTHEGYFLGELENAGYAASVFNKTFTVQYVNFWPDGWNNTNGRFTKSFEFFASHCVGAGGPDLAPYRLGQVANSYPFIAEYRNSLPITVMSVQEPTLNYTNPKT